MPGGATRARVLVFGEDPHDSAALKEFIETIRPDLVGRVQIRRRPLVLIKNARPEDLPRRAQLLAGHLAAEAAVGPLHAVVVHEDADDVEPAHRIIEEKVERALERIPSPVIPAIPAWELETWFFMWPDQVKAVRAGSWQAPTRHVGKNVGKIQNAKEALKKAVRPQGAKKSSFPDYRESDAPAIARKIRESGLALEPRAKSDSFSRFCAKLSKLSKI